MTHKWYCYLSVETKEREIRGNSNCNQDGVEHDKVTWKQNYKVHSNISCDSMWLSAVCYSLSRSLLMTATEWSRDLVMTKRSCWCELCRNVVTSLNAVCTTFGVRSTARVSCSFVTNIDTMPTLRHYEPVEWWTLPNSFQVVLGWMGWRRWLWIVNRKGLKRKRSWPILQEDRKSRNPY